MSNAPEWLNQGEGFTDVTLTRPLTVSGTKMQVIRLREPIVEDQLASEASGGSDAAIEIAMLSNLSEIAPEEIRKLSLRDYKRLQVAFMGFIG